MGFGIGLVDVVFLEDYLIVFGLLVVGVDYVIVVLVETVELLVYLRSHAVVTTDSLGDAFVLFGILLVEDNENKIETGEQRVGHTDVLCGCKLRLVLTVDRVGSCYN